VPVRGRGCLFGCARHGVVQVMILIGRCGSHVTVLDSWEQGRRSLDASAEGDARRARGF
jgi:hypothetical protein